MPLVPCPDCGRQVSTAAVSCPQCGRPNPAESASLDRTASIDTSPSPAGGERTPTSDSAQLAEIAKQRVSSEPAVAPDSGFYRAVAVGGGLLAFVMIVGMCNQGDPARVSTAGRADSASLNYASNSVPTLSAEDSARFKQRAQVIVQEHKPAGWSEEDRSRMIALADTVIFFGDTTDIEVRNWLAARRLAEEERTREQMEAAERAADAGKWRYSSDTDPMASRPSRTASIESENTVEFGFPYDGPQHATLTLRNHPSYGLDVILQIREGQILCPSYDDCSLRIRFDDGSVERFTAAGPADNSSTTVFIRNYSRFMQRMRNAKVVRIQIPVYQEGAPTFEFRVGGFDNERYRTGS